MYNSFGRCRKCAGSSVPKNATGGESGDSLPLNSLILGITAGILCVIFLITIFGLWWLQNRRKSQNKKNGSSFQPWKQARNLVVFIVLSLQPAAMVGNMVNIVGTEIVTPTHEIVLGVYNSMILDLSSTIPSSCTDGRLDNMLLVCAFATMMVFGICTIVSKCCQNDACSAQWAKLSEWMLKIMLLGYGYVAKLTFSTITSANSDTLGIGFAVAVMFMYCFFVPLISFCKLYAMKDHWVRLNHPILSHFVKIIEPSMWWCLFVIHSLQSSG